MVCMKEFEEDSRRFKKMYAEKRLEAEIDQEALKKIGKAFSA